MGKKFYVRIYAPPDSKIERVDLDGETVNYLRPSDLEGLKSFIIDTLPKLSKAMNKKFIKQVKEMKLRECHKYLKKRGYIFV